MLYFVQQFGYVWLQTRKFRPKCCTFYNNEPQYWFIPPFLLYKIQHLLYLENSAWGAACSHLLMVLRQRHGSLS